MVGAAVAAHLEAERGDFRALARTVRDIDAGRAGDPLAREIIRP